MTDRLPVRLWRALSAAWRGDAAAAPVRRAYHAAAPHRLLADWPGTSQSANKATRYQGKALRHRARELRENSPIVARFASLSRENIVGPDGITLQCVVPSSRGVNAVASKEIERAWYRWADAVTPDRRSLVDVLNVAVESWRVEGEALLEIIPSPSAPAGLWVVPLDADLLDDKKNEDRTPTGGSIVQGIEYDAAGRVVAYHLLTKHPSDGEVSRYRTLPPDRLLYLANRPRPQQARGVTPLAPVMTLIQHLERLEEAIVVLNRVAAAKMGALIPGEDAAPLEGADGVPPEITASPGEWWELPRGYDVKMLDPGQPTSEHDAFARHIKREIASGLGVAYASLTGDLSDVNYSSMRAGLLVERDAWQTLQQQVIAAVVAPLFRTFLASAPMARAFAMPNGQSADTIAGASHWHPRRWAWVDPLKDAEGIRVLLDLGLTTRTREANRLGLAFTELVDERAGEDAYLTAAGVMLSTDTAPAPASTADDDTANTGTPEGTT